MVRSSDLSTLLTRILVIGLGCLALNTSASFATYTNSEGIRVYQKNVHFSPERKQNLTEDIYRYRNANNLWDELRHEFNLPHYEDNPKVQRQINAFLNNSDELLEAAHRAAPYLYYILQQVRKRHLPIELVLLPIVESDYNPFAYSSAGAAGIWQMMPGTASGYGIKRNSWYDGRRDVIASTHAALNYLTYLQNFFAGNWQLALAAYDSGEGTVLNAIKRNIRDGRNTDFWSLPLPQETRDYVPRLLALAVIISHPERYPLNFPAVSNAPYLAQIDLGAQITLTQASTFSGVPLKKLIQLNPAYNRASVAQHGPSKLLLPIENVEQFSENLAKSPSYQYIDWMHYKVKSGDTLVTVASRFNTTPAMVQKLNSLASNKLKPGTNLVIPRETKNTPDVATEVAEEKTTTHKPTAIPEAVAIASALKNKTEKKEKYGLQPGDTLYMVRNGDDIEKIANRFHADLGMVLAANKIHSETVLHPGEKLIIPTHKIETAKSYKIAPGDTVYMVRKGDSIEKIAAKFHTTPSAIRLSNLLASNDVQEGDRLVIPTHM